jgi:hypothetical protein
MSAANAFSSLPEILQPKEEDIQMMLSAGGECNINLDRLAVIYSTDISHKILLLITLSSHWNEKL